VLFFSLVPNLAHAGVVELVDTQDLKSCEPKRSYGFDSRPRYFNAIINACKSITYRRFLIIRLRIGYNFHTKCENNILIDRILLFTLNFT
jgi:hypothetical protein